jgi:UDP-N-acetyl-D-galactosamine dehydrogenase
VADVIKTLQSYHLNIYVTDPYADSDELQHEYGFGLLEEVGSGYDAVIVSVPHQPYLEFDDSYFKSITTDNALIVDIKGSYRNKITSRKYWSL